MSSNVSSTLLSLSLTLTLTLTLSQPCGHIGCLGALQRLELTNTVWCNELKTLVELSFHLPSFERHLKSSPPGRSQTESNRQNNKNPTLNPSSSRCGLEEQYLKVPIDGRCSKIVSDQRQAVRYKYQRYVISATNVGTMTMYLTLWEGTDVLARAARA